MMSYPIINTFNDILLIEGTKPLVICDIDHTFIRPRNDYKFYYDLMSEKFESEEDRNELAQQLMSSSYNLGVIKQTDEDGFKNLLERIKNLDGKLIFLTARSADYHDKTLQDLKQVHLEDHDKYEIHFTNAKISKGSYLMTNKDILEGYDHISFIDDYTCYLDSVSSKFPDIKCYQFKY